MSLLKRYQENIVESTTVVETVLVKVKKVVGLKDDRRLMLMTDKGQFFVWTNNCNLQNPKSLLGQSFNASLDLLEKGEYINVVSWTVDRDSLDVRSFVSSDKVAVQL